MLVILQATGILQWLLYNLLCKAVVLGVPVCVLICLNLTVFENLTSWPSPQSLGSVFAWPLLLMKNFSGADHGRQPPTLGGGGIPTWGLHTTVWRQHVYISPPNYVFSLMAFYQALGPARPGFGILTGACIYRPSGP